MSFRRFGLAVFSAVIALSAQGGEQPLEIRCPQLHAKTDQAVVVEVRGAQDLAGKPIALRKEKTNVCEARFERQGELAVAKLSFDPLPWGIRPDVLDVVVDGGNLAQLTAPLVLIGMRGNPPQDEVLAALKAPGGLFPMIDRFGQYRHRDWPGKTKSLEDLRRHREAEQKDPQVVVVG